MLVEGIQRACLYAVIALPMALILGIVGIINLAHGDFMMLGAYFAYFLNVYTGMDPLVAIFPALFAFFLIGIVSYRAIIKICPGRSGVESASIDLWPGHGHGATREPGLDLSAHQIALKICLFLGLHRLFYFWNF